MKQKTRTVVAGALGECVHVAGMTNFLRLAESAGWRTVFLGPAISMEEMIAAAKREQADVVGNTIKAVDKVVDTKKASNRLDKYWEAAQRFAKGGKCSFSEDTQVTTQEGSESISAIEIGDYVLAWNEADGTFGYYEVTATWSYADKILTDLIIDGEWIETTPEHPFYVEGKGWTPAEDLQMVRPARSGCNGMSTRSRRCIISPLTPRIRTSWVFDSGWCITRVGRRKD